MRLRAPPTRAISAGPRREAQSRIVPVTVIRTPAAAVAATPLLPRNGDRIEDEASTPTA
jgi:hypothetical protein